MYQLRYRKSAEKALRQIPKADLMRIVGRIQALAEQPRPAGAIKLHGSQDIYRIRQGDYRIIYLIQDEIVTVTVIKIGHRKDVYERR